MRLYLVTAALPLQRNSLLALVVARNNGPSQTSQCQCYLAFWGQCHSCAGLLDQKTESPDWYRGKPRQEHLDGCPA